ALEALGPQVLQGSKGVRGAPYTYRRVCPDSIPSRPHPIEEETNPGPEADKSDTPPDPRPSGTSEAAGQTRGATTCQAGIRTRPTESGVPTAVGTERLAKLSGQDRSAPARRPTTTRDDRELQALFDVPLPEQLPNVD